MTLSLSSRFVVVGLAALVLVAGLNYCASDYIFESQQRSQVSALLERFSHSGESNLSKLDQDLQIVAPGNVLRVFDSQGQQVYGDRQPLAEATLSWSRGCATASGNPCFRGRSAASSFVPDHSATGFLVLTLPRAPLRGLLPWTLGGTLLVAILLAFTFERLADIVYRRPLRDLRQSTHLVATGVPQALKYVRPEHKTSMLSAPLKALVLRDEEIESGC